MIKHLSHKKIQQQKWDENLAVSPGRVPYARSWYLNLVCPGWEALQDENEGYFMPLPVTYSRLVRQILQPPYCQQLGIFGPSLPDLRNGEAFLSHPAWKAFRVHYAFNASNQVPTYAEGISMKPDYVLTLNQPYEKIVSRFSENTARNVKKAAFKNLQVRQDQNMEALLELKWRVRPPGLKKKHFYLAQNIVQEAVSRHEGEIWSVYGPQEEYLAGCFFLNDDVRSVYLISASSDRGKESGAMFLLLERFIQRYAGSGRFLDFEGSSIPGIARFFLGFGAVNTPFPVIYRINFSPFR